jgi:hypothetical protein
VTDKKSLQINKLEHVLVVQMFPSERNMLWNAAITIRFLALPG